MRSFENVNDLTIYIKSIRIKGLVRNPLHGNRHLKHLCEHMAEIETTRQLGYAIDNEENEVGVRCIATSLLCRQENIAYAFSVSSLKSRITDVRITEIAECLLEIKKQIEKLFI